MDLRADIISSEGNEERKTEKMVLINPLGPLQKKNQYLEMGFRQHIVYNLPPKQLPFCKKRVKSTRSGGPGVPDVAWLGPGGDGGPWTFISGDLPVGLSLGLLGPSIMQREILLGLKENVCQSNDIDLRDLLIGFLFESC